MRTRQQSVKRPPEEKKPTRKLTAVPAPATARKGGARKGAGRPAYLKPHERKKSAGYVSLTAEEKEQLEAEAEEEGLTLSFYLRKKIGLPVE